MVPNDCGSKWRFESVKFSIIFRFSRISKRDSPELCRRENISYAQVALTDTPAKLFLPLKYQVTKNLTNTAVKTFIRDWDWPSGSFACWPGTGQPGPCCSHLRHTHRIGWTIQYNGHLFSNIGISKTAVVLLYAHSCHHGPNLALDCSDMAVTPLTGY